MIIIIDNKQSLHTIIFLFSFDSKIILTILKLNAPVYYKQLPPLTLLHLYILRVYWKLAHNIKFLRQLFV